MDLFTLCSFSNCKITFSFISRAKHLPVLHLPGPGCHILGFASRLINTITQTIKWLWEAQLSHPQNPPPPPQLLANNQREVQSCCLSLSRGLGTIQAMPPPYPCGRAASGGL